MNTKSLITETAVWRKTKKKVPVIWNVLAKDLLCCELVLMESCVWEEAC